MTPVFRGKKKFATVEAKKRNQLAVFLISCECFGLLESLNLSCQSRESLTS